MDDRVASKPILMEQAVTDLCDPVFRENSVGATSAQVLRQERIHNFVLHALLYACKRTTPECIAQHSTR